MRLVVVIPHMAKSKSINLLPQEEFEASTMGRVLRWAMGTFRIIVIITEMIVMAAFLSRFWLDAQNSDLNDSVKIKSAQVSAQSDFEKEFRGLQEKLDIFKKIRSDPKTSDKINLIASKVPSNVVLSSVSLNETSSEVKGTSDSELSIAQFISNLKADKSFKSVEINNVGSSQNDPGLTDFSIKVSY